MKVTKQQGVVHSPQIHRGTIEGVILVDGKPQIEQADMPLTLSFETIEDLERFCKAANTNQKHK